MGEGARERRARNFPRCTAEPRVVEKSARYPAQFRPVGQVGSFGPVPDVSGENGARGDDPGFHGYRTGKAQSHPKDPPATLVRLTVRPAAVQERRGRRLFGG
jgi:hypothetical protein